MSDTTLPQVIFLGGRAFNHVNQDSTYATVVASTSTVMYDPYIIYVGHKKSIHPLSSVVYSTHTFRVHLSFPIYLTQW